MTRFIAIDWGTTNRRIFLIEGGAVVEALRDDLGAVAVDPNRFPTEVNALRTRFGVDPVLLAGMVGSNRGWIDAGYLSAPLPLSELAHSLVRPLPGAAIVPGMCWREGTCGDVMRGEEVQLLGASGTGAMLACLPGTHCKWARLDGERLDRFTTAMTGEMFALLKKHALIGHEMTGPAADDAAFGRGLEEARRGDLLASLFGVRSARLLDLAPAGEASSYVSGLLIGADVQAHVAPGERVTLISQGTLAALYTRAIEAWGGSVSLVDSEAAFVAGCVRIMETVQ